MQTTKTTIETATSLAQLTRETRYASGSNGGAVNLTVSREATGYLVAWNVKRGRGWAKGWKRTTKTEQDAFAFAIEKWPTLIAWLEKLEPVEGDGAAEAFSAQIAGMSR